MKKYFENILPYFFVFIASLFTPKDLDLGWHLKYGEYFFRHDAVLRDNTFSSMMPDFKWANTSWLTDLITYQAFNLGGFLGITILGAITITLIFFVFSKVFDLSFWEKSLVFPILIIAELPVNQVSFRGQLLSILFTGILILILRFYEKGQSRIIFLLPILFLFWTNLHGQFFLGLFIFFLWFFFWLLKLFVNKELKNNLGKVRNLFLSLVASLLTPLINPFGIELYKTVVLHPLDPNLEKIIEYLPFPTGSTEWWTMVAIGILVFLGIIFMFFEEKLKNNIPSLGVFSVLYLLSFSVRRYSWTMYYFSIPFLKKTASFFHPGKKPAFYVSTVLFSVYILTAVFLKWPLSQFAQMNWERYCLEVQDCSPKAIDFIRENNLTENLFSMYNWGGWMIWNYPQVKPTIDGRMHLWRDEKGYSGFEDYFAYEQDFEDINGSSYDVVLMAPDKPVYKRLVELSQTGEWSLVYEDQNAGVFVRNQTTLR